MTTRSAMSRIGVTLAILLGGCGSTEPTARESRIVFRAFEPQAINLFSMKADGSDLQRVTDDSIVEGDPSWSPDGSKIVFSGTLPRDVRNDLYVVNADGSGLRKLLLNDADNHQPE